MFVRLIVVIVSVLSLVMLVNAQDNPIYGLVTVDTAEIRTGPDFAYPVVGQLPLNTSVEITGRSGDFFRRWDGRQWLRINYGSETAWIYARLLRTSIAFNSIPPVGRLLPRNADGRVPPEFDLTTDLCSQWQGAFNQSASVLGNNETITVTYPALQGANVYSVIVISPSGTRRAFDSTTTTAEILESRLPRELGTYTWRVAPYWTDAPQRFRWQQICLLQTGGTFEKPQE